MKTESAAPIVVPGFRIRRRLGEGGMGVVYEAERVAPGGFRKLVALKELSLARGRNEDAFRRFFREARISARLDHPNIVRIDALEMVDGKPFLVMELLLGSDLAVLVRGAAEGLPAWVGLEVAAQALEGLAHAHDLRDEEGAPLGLVHRDVTPRNVFVCDGGQVKLLDFGIAKLNTASDDLTRTEVGPPVTATFAPPEALERRPVTPRSDLYQLGATLLFALTGELPFGRGNATDVLTRMRQTGGEPDGLGALPRSVRDVIARAMAPDPADRFASAREMRDAVEGALRAVRPNGVSLTEWLRATGETSRVRPCALPEPKALLVPRAELPEQTTKPAALARSDRIKLPGLPHVHSRFEVKGLLGRGGMGLVLEAHDQELGRDVALKLLLDERLGDESVLRRFRREARAAASLRHPNIVMVHDIDPDGRFIVMELVRGETLARHLESHGQLPAADLFRIGDALLSALAAAHARGIVHRDVKPANVLLGEDGVVRLADFGVASFADCEPTSTGAGVGTPAYMAPEQLRSGRVDARADVYAAGATLFEAATGKKLHDASGRCVDPAAEVRRATGSLRLARAIARATEERPDGRFAEAGEFREALAETPPPAGSGRLVWGAALAVALLAIGGGAAAWAWTSSPPETTPAVVAASPAALRTVAVLPFDVRTDDSRLDFAADGLAQLLAEEIERSSELHVVDYYQLRDAVPIADAPVASWMRVARRLGAETLLAGRLDDLGGGKVRLTIRIHDRDGADRIATLREATVEDIPGALFRAVGEIIGAVSGAEAEPADGPVPAFDAERQLRLGIIALRNRYDFAEARERLEAALREAPGSGTAHYHLAIAKWWQSLPPEGVLPHVERALAADPTPAQAAFLEGLRLLVDHRYGEATARFRRGVSAHPGSQDLRYGLFESLFHGGYPTEAMAEYAVILRVARTFRLGMLHPLMYFISRGVDPQMTSYTQLIRRSAVPGDAVWPARALVARRDEPGALAFIESSASGYGSSEAGDVNTLRLALEAMQIHAVAGRLDQARAILDHQGPSIDPFEREQALQGLALASGQEIAAQSYRRRALREAVLIAPVRLDRLIRVATVDVAAGAGAAPELLREDLQRIRESATPREKRTLNYHVIVALLAGVMGDGALLAEMEGSPFPEAAAIAAAFSAERDGRPADAAEAWRRALAHSADGRFRITEEAFLARALAAAGDGDGARAACDEAVRPRLFDWSWAPAALTCRPLLAD